MNENERILAKVRKCLALGNNEGATEAERERALAQAGKLLASINLSMAAVAETIDDRVRQAHEVTPELMEWPVVALQGIASLFFCKYYRSRSEKKHYYVGKTVNVTATIMMAEYVMVNIIKEAKKRASAAKASEALLGTRKDGTGYGKEWEYAFCLGAAVGVAKKCDELILQRERDGVSADADGMGGTALAVVGLSKQEMARNLAMLSALGVHLSHSNIKGARDGAAYGAGNKHGSSINLSRQVGSSSGPKLLS